jgi:ABC-type uncharacterized transport system fused permease/ATPase subunit
VDKLYGLYVKNQTYYRVENCDSRMTNPDQCLTDDVASFCAQLAHIYSQITKPIFDVVLMTTQLLMLARERAGTGLEVGCWLVVGWLLLVVVDILFI